STGVAVKTEAVRYVMSTEIGDRTGFTVEVTDLKTNAPAEGIDVILTSTQTSAFGLADAVGVTDADGKFRTELIAVDRGTGYVEVDVRGKTTRSNVIMVDAPNITIATSYTTVHEGETFETNVFARHANSNEFIDNHDVIFRSDDDGATFTPSDKVTTDDEGEARVTVSPSKQGTIQVWAEIGGYITERKSVNVIDVAGQEVNASVDREEMTTGVNDFVTLTVETHGVPVGTTINVSSDGDVFTYDNPTGQVSDMGIWTTRVHLKPTTAVGVQNLVVECNNETLHIDILVISPKISIWIDPSTAVTGSNLKVTALVSDQNGTPLGQEFDVAFTGSAQFVGVPATVKTGVNGIASFNVVAPVQGNHTITATVGSVTSAPAVVNTGGMVLDVTGDFATKMNTGKYRDVEVQVLIGGTATRDIEVWANSSSSSVLSVVAPRSGLTDNFGKFKFQLASAFAEGTADIVFGIRETVSGVTATVTKTITVSDAFEFNMTASAQYPNATIGVNQVNPVTVQLTSSTGVVSNLPVTVSDPKGMFSFSPASGTADASGIFRTTATAIGIVGDTTEVEVVCKDKTVKVPMSIKAPKIVVTVTPNPAHEGAEITGTASVFFDNGTTPVGPGVDLTWDVQPAVLPAFNNPSYQTNSQGKVIITDKLTSNSDFEFMASVEDTYHSNLVTLVLADFEVGITSTQSGKLTTGDQNGRPMVVKTKVGTTPVKNAT
ncbi:MAG: Ig-like domain-containing protein, partial [Fusobacteriaceae bacterium]